MQTEDLFFDNKKILERCEGKKVLIYGAGTNGQLFLKKFINKLNIVAFIDKYKVGDINSIPILRMDEINQVLNNAIIVVTPKAGFTEICSILNDAGCIVGEDYVFWDTCFFRYRKKFIEFSKKVWQKDLSSQKNKILIPYMMNNVLHYNIMSYTAHYLADKYNASISAYVVKRPNFVEHDFNDDMYKEIYDSFGTSEYILERLTLNQKEEVERIYNKICSDIQTDHDCLGIEIYNRNYGRQICRDYFRYCTPSFKNNKEIFLKYIHSVIPHIVFWNDFFKEDNSIKAIITADGFYRDGFLTDVAVEKGIPVYKTNMDNSFRYTGSSMNFGESYKYYKKFFNELSIDEQKKGMEWSKIQLEKRLNGDTSDIPYMDAVSPYSSKVDFKLKTNAKTKVMICAHSFQDDTYANGWQIFDSVFDWMRFLGEISKTLPYDWYFKEHPNADERDKKIYASFLSKYKHINKIPGQVSPRVLKNQGVKFALTVSGTLGHEYPAMGIQVINAGNNPHIAFDFDWNPKTIEEYMYLIKNLDRLNKEIEMDDIYRFYCIHYLYYESQMGGKKEYFFDNPNITSSTYLDEVNTIDISKEWNVEHHKRICANINKYFFELDHYVPDEFRRRISVIC